MTSSIRNEGRMTVSLITEAVRSDFTWNSRLTLTNLLERVRRISIRAGHDEQDYTNPHDDRISEPLTRTISVITDSTPHTMTCQAFARHPAHRILLGGFSRQFGQSLTPETCFFGLRNEIALYSSYDDHEDKKKRRFQDLR